MRNSGVNVTPTKRPCCRPRASARIWATAISPPTIRTIAAARWRAGSRCSARRPRPTSTRSAPSFVAARRGAGRARRRHQPQPLHLPQSRHQRRLVGDGAPLHAGRARPDARHRLGARPGQETEAQRAARLHAFLTFYGPRRLCHAGRRRRAGAGAAGLRRVARGAVDRSVARHGFEPGAARDRRGPSPRVLAQVG